MYSNYINYNLIDDSLTVVQTLVLNACLPQVRDRISTFLISIFFTIYIMSHAYILEDKKWLILKLASYVYAYCMKYFLQI